VTAGQVPSVKCHLKIGLDCPVEASVIIDGQCIGCHRFDEEITNNPGVMVECNLSQPEIEGIIYRHQKASKGVRV